MNARAIWSFIAGDSWFAPAAVAVAVLLVLGLERWTPVAADWIGVAFVATIAAGLVASVYERTR